MRVGYSPFEGVTVLARTIGSRVGDPRDAPSRLDPDDAIGLDIVIPAHNEAHRIGPTLHSYRRAFAHPDTRFIVALDDCDDATADIVRRHAEGDSRVELHAFPKLGKGGVIRKAFERGRSDLVAFVDADGSTSPEQLARLVAAARHGDGAIASRRLPSSSVLGRRSLIRTVGSAVFAWLVRRLFGLPYRDTQCGAKVMRRSALDLLLPRLTTSDLLFDLDLLLRAEELDCRIVEVPTVWVTRAGSRVRPLRESGRLVASLLRLWKDHRRRRLLFAETIPARRPHRRDDAVDVVMVSPYPSPGRSHGASTGVAAYTASLARALTDLGVSVAVVAPDETNAPPIHSHGGVVVVRCGPRGPLALTRAMRIAADMRPRVIHLQHELFAFGGVTSLAALPLAVRQLRRYEGGAITTVHQVIGADDVGRELMKLHRLPGPVATARMGMTFYRRLVASAGVNVVHETGFARHLSDAVVIPHGVERTAVPDRNQARQRLGMRDEQRLVVLCFGFVAPYKGLESALAAAADVPEVLLVVAGGHHPRHGASYTNSLKNRWGDVARFTGWVPEEDIPAWHAAADLALFCYPAPHSSSAAIATALAHGTPLLASDALARGMALPRDVAFSLEGGDLARRLHRLATNRGLLADLAQASARLAAGRSWHEVASRHLRLYQEVADRSMEIAIDGADVIPPDQGQLEVA